MGSAIAGRLLDCGHQLTLFDPDPGPMAPLLARGARRAAVAADTLDGGMVITLVPDDRAVAAAWLDDSLVAKLPQGTVHACMASISYDMGRRLSDAHVEVSRRYLSVPLFGRPPLAARGELDLIVAGSTDSIEACRPVLQAIGRQIIHIGDRPEQANLVKIARNFLVASLIESLGEAFALCGKGGVRPERFLAALVGTSLDSPACRYYGNYLVKRSRETLLPMTLGLKDVELALQSAEHLGLELPTARLIRAHMVSAIEEGWGERDWAALAEWIGERNGWQRDP